MFRLLLGKLVNRDRVKRGAKGGAGVGIIYGQKPCHKIKNDNKYFKKQPHILIRGTSK
jgi:DNA transposition AAA+ family ATPase